MLIDIQYEDDGFTVDILLLTQAEQALSDEQIARQVWWPGQIRWKLRPVWAEVRHDALPRIPSAQRWTFKRQVAGAEAIDEALQTVRDANECMADDAKLSEQTLQELEATWRNGLPWMRAIVSFPE